MPLIWIIELDTVCWATDPWHTSPILDSCGIREFFNLYFCREIKWNETETLLDE